CVKEGEQPDHAPQTDEVRQPGELPDRRDHQSQEDEVERRLAVLQLQELDGIDSGAEAEPAEKAACHPGERHQGGDEHSRLVEEAIAALDAQKYRRRSMPW